MLATKTNKLLHLTRSKNQPPQFSRNSQLANLGDTLKRKV